MPSASISITSSYVACSLLYGSKSFHVVQKIDLPLRQSFASKISDTRLSDGFENINLTTYGFQAPEFYQKCGYRVEFIRRNKENPKLDKYYFVRYLKNN